MSYMRASVINWAVAAFAAVAAYAPAAAETVTQPQAKAIASQFFNAANGQYMVEPTMVYNGRKLTTQRLFVPFYVYNHPSGGYVIISAENKAFPILAYSTSGKFDANAVSDDTKSILTSYARDIELIRYDDRVPYEAIAACGDLPHYIDNLLNARTDKYNVKYTSSEAEDMIARLDGDPDNDDQLSEIYSPSQWSEMVADELTRNGNVALGFDNGKDISAVTVTGRKGDYFIVNADVPDGSYFRLFATEYLSDGQLAVLSNPIGLPEVQQEETPFRFYDDFIAETKAAEQQRQRAIEEAGMVTEPVLHTHGSGFYTVDLPEEAALVRLYNLGGAMVRQYTYKNTTSPHFELIAEPTGFYLALIVCKSGRTYGVKLVR